MHYKQIECFLCKCLKKSFRFLPTRLLSLYRKSGVHSLKGLSLFLHNRLLIMQGSGQTPTFQRHNVIFFFPNRVTFSFLCSLPCFVFFIAHVVIGEELISIAFYSSFVLLQSIINTIRVGILSILSLLCPQLFQWCLIHSKCSIFICLKYKR